MGSRFLVDQSANLRHIGVGMIPERPAQPVHPRGEFGDLHRRHRNALPCPLLTIGRSLPRVLGSLEVLLGDPVPGRVDWGRMVGGTADRARLPLDQLRGQCSGYETASNSIASPARSSRPPGDPRPRPGPPPAGQGLPAGPHLQIGAVVDGERQVLLHFSQLLHLRFEHRPIAGRGPEPGQLPIDGTVASLLVLEGLRGGGDSAAQFRPRAVGGGLCPDGLFQLGTSGANPPAAEFRRCSPRGAIRPPCAPAAAARSPGCPATSALRSPLLSPRSRSMTRDLAAQHVQRRDHRQHGPRFLRKRQFARATASMSPDCPARSARTRSACASSAKRAVDPPALRERRLRPGRPAPPAPGDAPRAPRPRRPWPGPPARAPPGRRIPRASRRAPPPVRARRFSSSCTASLSRRSSSSQRLTSKSTFRIVLAVPAVGRKELAELPLRQQDDLAELGRVETEDLADALVDVPHLGGKEHAVLGGLSFAVRSQSVPLACTALVPSPRFFLISWIGWRLTR